MAANNQLPAEYQNEGIFVEPHYWVADSSFARTLVNQEIDDVNQLFSSLFNGERTQPITTACIDNSISWGLGRDHLIDGRAFMNCVHKDEASEEDCLLALVGQDNPFAVTVATQENRERFSQRNVVPVACFDNNHNLVFAPLSPYQILNALEDDRDVRITRRRAEKVEMKKTISKAKFAKKKKMAC